MKDFISLLIVVVLLFALIAFVSALPRLDVPANAQPNDNGKYKVNSDGPISVPIIVLIVVIILALSVAGAGR